MTLPTRVRHLIVGAGIRGLPTAWHLAIELRDRGLAVLQSEPEVFRRVARRAAELHTGAPRPEDGPLSVTRSHTGI